MKKTILFIFILLLLITLQTTSLGFLSFKGASPNLVLIFFLLLVIFKGFEKTWWIIVIAGLLLDFFSSLPFGAISVGLVLACFLIDWFNQKIFSGIKLWTGAFLVILGNLIYYLSIYVINQIFY
ncbi:MAG: rod shape-determining protein MreD [Candidatus Portnoybacteria bacterium]